MESNIVEIKLSEIDKVQEVLSKQNQEIERLNDRINKAIEYIESYMPNYAFDKTNLRKLLEILQGSDKE